MLLTEICNSKKFKFYVPPLDSSNVCNETNLRERKSYESHTDMISETLKLLLRDQAKLSFIQAEISSMYDFTKPSTSAQRQAVAAKDVIKRTIPNQAHRFKIKINFQLKSHTFRITKNNFSKNVLIEASSGVIACKGFYYYLKYYLNSHIAWEGSNIKFPKYLPNVNVTETSPSQFIFYQNVCSYSYSYAFWQWPEWRKHIDWMVMQGITLTIAPVQEMIWERVYIKLGLSRKEIDAHFAGPAFLAWQRMGNLRGWGGPLTTAFKVNSSTLQKQIIEALRELGVVIALPAFAGHVPVSFRRLFPNSTYRSIVIWKKGFPENLRGPLFLEPSDELFKNVGTLFLTEMLTEYGSNHIYYADPFYKIEQDLASAKYLTNVANGIYETMKLVDPKAIWMLQSWIFEKNPFLSDDIIKAFLTTVPIGKMILLDLYSEQKPFYNRTSSFHGQPFIWCMLHNFGATLGLHGSVATLNEDIVYAKKFKNSSMIGVGIAPEGVNQNYVIYEFALERGWYQNSVIIKEWFDHYTFVRYGAQNHFISSAWDYLLKTVYSFRGTREISGKYIVCRQPSLSHVIWSWYNLSDFDEVLRNFLKASQYPRSPNDLYNYDLAQNDLYNYDLVDITRQMIQNKVEQLYTKIVVSFESKNVKEFELYTKHFEHLLHDLELILSTNDKFLLGNWLESAKNLATTDFERHMYEFNARNQITIWGPTGQVYDYAMKQWSGMIVDYCIPRWTIFFNELHNSLKTNHYFNETECKNIIFKEIEEPFMNDNKLYDVVGHGNATAIANEIYNKWKNIFN